MRPSSTAVALSFSVPFMAAAGVLFVLVQSAGGLGPLQGVEGAWRIFSVPAWSAVLALVLGAYSAMSQLKTLRSCSLLFAFTALGSIGTTIGAQILLVGWLVPCIFAVLRLRALLSRQSQA